MRWFVVSGVIMAAAILSTARAAPSCQLFKVAVPSLNVSPEPRGDATYIDVLDSGDIACVTRAQRVGDRDWSFIAYVVKGSERRTVEGWANQQGLQRMPTDAGAAPPPDVPNANATLAPQTPPPAPSSEQATAAPPPSSSPPTSPQPSSSPQTPAASGGEAVRWGEPIPFGPLPVNGQTIEQLVHRQPLFSPLEGLDESAWKADCGACHQWTRETLCGQGNLYVKDPRKVLRIKHPYGGAFKIALWRWAKGGCN